MTQLVHGSYKTTVDVDVGLRYPLQVDVKKVATKYPSGLKPYDDIRIKGIIRNGVVEKVTPFYADTAAKAVENFYFSNLKNDALIVVYLNDGTMKRYNAKKTCVEDDLSGEKIRPHISIDDLLNMSEGDSLIFVNDPMHFVDEYNFGMSFDEVKANYNESPLKKGREYIFQNCVGTMVDLEGDVLRYPYKCFMKKFVPKLVYDKKLDSGVIENKSKSTLFDKMIEFIYFRLGG